MSEKKGISIEASAQKVLDLLAEVGPRGCRNPYRDYDPKDPKTSQHPAFHAALMGSLGLKWDLAWGIGADLSIRWERPGVAKVWEPQVRITWCSSGYSPAEARVAAKLHAEVADFACLLEAVFADQHITRDTEKPL